MLKIVNAALKAKTKAWTFKAKAINFGLVPRGASKPRLGLEDYITGDTIR